MTFMAPIKARSAKHTIGIRGKCPCHVPMTLSLLGCWEARPKKKSDDPHHLKPKALPYHHLTPKASRAKVKKAPTRQTVASQAHRKGQLVILLTI